MWVNPRSKMNSGGHIAWDRREADAGDPRYLDLAEVALGQKTASPGETETSIASDDADEVKAFDQATPHWGISSARRQGVRTAIPVRSSLEYEILHWAIHADFLEDVAAGNPPGWESWSRVGVLTTEQLVIDWKTPHIESYAEFIMQRLQALSAGSRDTHARVASKLEKLIRRSVKRDRNAHPERAS